MTRKNPFQRMMVKIGGAALQDAASLKAVSRTLAELSASGQSLVVVHGGGPAINEELEASGLTWSFVDGLRVTTPEMMSRIEKALCGTVNRQVVQALQAEGLKPVGLSAADGGLLQCEALQEEKFGRVGRVCDVNPAVLRALLRSTPDVIPVVAPVGVGTGGERYNVNADWAAVHMALALGIGHLVFVTDQDGIRSASGDSLPMQDCDDLADLITSGTVHGGMLTKTRAVAYALRHGLPRVQIVKAQGWSAGPVGERAGTVCLPAQPFLQIGGLR